MKRYLVGSTYGRFCIKFPQSRMKGERHRQPLVFFNIERFNCLNTIDTSCNFKCSDWISQFEAPKGAQFIGFRMYCHSLSCIFQLLRIHKNIQYNFCNQTPEYSAILWHLTKIYGPEVQYNLVKPSPSVQPDFGTIMSLAINWVRTENRKSTVWF